METKEFYKIEELTGKRDYAFLSDYLRHEKFSSIHLDPQLILVFEEKTGLLFNEEPFNENAACYALSPEIRQDFKIDFNTTDLINYTLALLHFHLSSTPEALDMISLKLPTSSDNFWKISEIGAEIRNEYQKKKTAKIPAPSDKKFFLMIFQK